MTEEMAPFQDLLKRNRQFYWDETMNKLFEKVKMRRIVEKVVEGVKHFEMNRNTCLATDFSKTKTKTGLSVCSIERSEMWGWSLEVGVSRL